MAWPGPTMQSYAKAHDHTRGRSPATSPLNHVRQLIAPVQLAFCLQHDGRVRTCIGPKSWVGTGTPGLNVRAGKVWSSSASVASHGSAQQERSLDAVPVTTAHSASAAPDTVQVTHFNFWQQLPRVQEALKNCSFFAFDCEFTGKASCTCRGGIMQAVWLGGHPVWMLCMQCSLAHAAFLDALYRANFFPQHDIFQALHAALQKIHICVCGNSSVHMQLYLLPCI